MASVTAPGLGRWRLLFVAALGVLYASLFVSVIENFEAMDRGGSAHPFGIVITPGGGLFVQDFAYNMLFLRGIHDHGVARPYSLEGQVEMARQIVPESESGMHHAYSPVAFVLTLPLPFVSNFQAYLVYFILTGAGILVLAYFHLLPNATHPLQIGALLVTLPSVCTLTALAVGQSAMLTTVLLGAFWILLRRGPSTRTVWTDLALAVLFWAICFKPSVAFVPFLLLIGAQAWRALAFGSGLLLATWTLVCGYYGGWWTGLQDYAYLVSHYNNGRTAPFSAPVGQISAEVAPWLAWLAFKRDCLFASGAGLVALRWMGRITLAEFFQLLVWAFVLFCPYLLPSEDWILCLLIVEGSFFQSGRLIVAGIKLLLFAMIFNIRANIGLTDGLGFPIECVLLAMLIVEMIRAPGSRRTLGGGLG